MIRNVADERKRRCGTKAVRSVEDTEDRAVRVTKVLVPVTKRLKAVYEGGVEARGGLNAHAAWNEGEINQPEVAHPIPLRLVLGDDALDNRIGRANVYHDC